MTPANVNYWVIIPAAGIGQRMQNTVPKQYLSIAGRPVLSHTLLPFINADWVTKIIVVLAADDDQFNSTEFAQHKKISLTQGAQTRTETVLNGLLALAEIASAQDWVLIHDAVRPCLKITDLNSLLLALQHHRIGGLLAKPVTDTLKQTNSQQQVMATISRQHLWHALTPQMFRYDLLVSALQLVKTEQQLVTDEAAAVEYAGYQPLIVQGSSSNIKITYPEDLLLAEYYLQNRYE